MTPPEPSRSRAGRRIALGVLQLALTVAVTVFILRRVGLGLEDLAALGTDVWRPRGVLFALSCAALLAGYVASAWIWSRVVVDLGGPALPIGVATEIYLVANLGRYVPGKLWQIAGLAVLALRRGVPISVSTSAAILGQAVALGGAALVGSAALLTGHAQLGSWSLAFVAVLGLGLAVVLIPPLHERAFALWFRMARRGDLAARPSGLTTLRWLALYTLNWVLYAAAFLALVRSFELPGPSVHVASAFAAAYVLGYAALFAPAGIGVREGFLVLFLSPVMGVAQAGAISIVARVWTTVVEILPAAALWVLHIGRTMRTAGEGEGAPPEGGGEERQDAGSSRPSERP